MATNTLIPTLDHSGEIPAYVARPAGTPRGAIIVVQEIFGVNSGIVKKAEDWAAEGYLAIAPDIFWRQEAGVELDHDIPAEFQKAIQLMLAHDFDRGVEDLKAVLAWARDEGTPRVGLVGFCMGGKIAYQMAARSTIDAAVGYYGVGLDQMLDEAANITGKLLLHIPTADEFVTAAAQAAVHQGLEGNPHITLYDYEGLGHGFAETHGSRRHEAGAQLADERSRAFLAEVLTA
ncbi:MAG TPA: dienelactone hydrolase family protein [Novosphingobium sp.]|nr:dienelactone hydrolase family protein [Novosphingobium sp.]HZV08517.1 dienelactone hydrolase family protein [Novosphingobium sp.]